MKKKNRVQSYSRKTIIIALSLFVLLTMGVGYSILGSNLSFQGLIGVSEYDDTLYGVLKKAAKKGTYAAEYTDAHDDSFTINGTKKIYYWRADDAAEGEIVDNLNNVILNNQCFKMIRTTDTGGVKLLYNGLAEGGKCLDSREPGYGPTTSVGTNSLDNDYYYSDSFVYDVSTGTFSLTGNVFQYHFTYDESSDFNTIKGKFTCLSTEINGTCTVLRQIDRYSNNNVYNNPLQKSPTNKSFGQSYFNGRIGTYDYEASAYAGYMNKNIYDFTIQNIIQRDEIASYTRFHFGNSTTNTIYYSDSVKWDSSYNCFVLDEYTTFRAEDASSRLPESGGYFSSSPDSCAKYMVRYSISGGSYGWADVYGMSLGKDSTCTDQPCPFIFYTISDQYQKNDDGTATLINPQTITNYDWYYHYEDYQGYYMCKGVTDTCSDLYNYISSSPFSDKAQYEPVYYLANDFEYYDGKYHLTGGGDYTNLFTDSSPFNNNHYSCFNIGGVCDQLSYVVYYTDGNLWSGMSSSGVCFTITLKDGESVEDALQNSFSGDDVNQKDSIVKRWVDFWYQYNMSDYSSYLEDTIYCNNRTFSDLAGWNRNGGDVTTSSSFAAPSLTCQAVTDQFSVSNPKAQLTYPVGLLTKTEYDMLNYHTTSSVRSESYWLMTPSYLYYYRSDVSTGGPVVYVGNYTHTTSNIGWGVGIRPVISLKPGLGYSSGDGSKENPYVVATN